MTEYCYTESCGHGVVAPELQDTHTKNMCAFVMATLSNAGVSGILETSPCPFVAINNLQPLETDTIEQASRKIELCGKLGIEGFYSSEEME